jgi:hypothetical protein
MLIFSLCHKQWDFENFVKQMYASRWLGCYFLTSLCAGMQTEFKNMLFRKFVIS